jgi:hypothetical protein
MLVARSLNSVLSDKVPGALPVVRQNSMLRVKTLSLVGTL